MVRFEDSKAYKLAKLMGGDPDSWTTEERALASTEEMIMDVTLSMATGNVSTWIQLARLYDEDKSLTNQSMEFQRQAAVTAAGSIGMGLVLYGTGTTSLEFAVGRAVAMRPVTSVLYNPVVAAPAAMIYVAAKMPEYAGPQYQSAMTGQPSIGGSALNKRAAKSWREFFSAGYWGF